MELDTRRKAVHTGPKFPRKTKELTMPMTPLAREINEQTLSPAAKSQEAIREQIRAMRNQPIPEYTPPPRPPALIEATRLEMEEGARRVAIAAENRAKILPQKKPVAEGTTEPVYRPGDHVPSLSVNEAQHVPTKSYKVL